MPTIRSPRPLWLALLCLGALACDGDDRDGYMLAFEAQRRPKGDDNPLADSGYDWWWHSFVGTNRATGELQPFFVEYFVINPALGHGEPILGQLLAHRASGRKPSYAMLKAGTWAENDSREINNFFGIADFRAASDRMEVRIGENYATDTRLVGSVSMGAAEATDHPEYMSDTGSLSWDLKVDKILSYSPGYGASKLFRKLDAFEMFWHVPGMKAEYSGTITLDGQVFDVVPATSYGYQDKNWGRDYTNPWIWLNCNHFTSRATGEALADSSLVVGGGRPVVFGFGLDKTVLVAFHHQGTLYEWNLTKELVRQDAEFTETSTSLEWRIEASDLGHRIRIEFAAPRSKAQKIDYENPRGQKQHENLWNTGFAAGTVELYERTWWGGWSLVDTLDGKLGGAEYGEH